MCKAGKQAYTWLGLSDALAACWDLLEAPFRLDDFKPEGFINYLGVTGYVKLVGCQADSHPCAEFKWDLP